MSSHITEPANTTEKKRLSRRHAAPLKSGNVLSQVSDMDLYDKIKLIRKGITKEQLEAFKKESGLDYDSLATVLSVTKATLHNKKGNEVFNITVSERFLALADLFAFGYEVFGEKERFIKWLNTGIRATGGIPPIDLLDTLYGIEEAKNIIGRAAYGVYS